MTDAITVANGGRYPSSLAVTQLQPELELQHLKRIRDDDDDSTVTDGLLSDKTSCNDYRQTSFNQNSSRTPTPHPLFPPLPSYGPPSFTSRLKYLGIRCVSSVLSHLFLGIVVFGALLHSVAGFISTIRVWLTGKDPRAQRVFHAEERTRSLEREDHSRKWERRQEKKEVDEEAPDECPPLEGGKDPIVCDVAYYARRVGLDVETFKVQTEDGFILTLWHVYNPQEYTPLPPRERRYRGPHVFTGQRNVEPGAPRRKYPILLVHGLLQSSGAYCANDDDSLAFYLCKSGYDVWLGNNRCGLGAEHTTLAESDPRMWAWNIRHFGFYDLPALVSRVLYETGFEKLGLVAHSQGTTQTFVALAKDQRPELGERISVFCGLAPAVYAGPLVERVYFRFMRLISPAVFRTIFGIHSFIPFMITMHRTLPPRIYGTLGYFVFSYLFGWSDTRWDRGLRDRMFQFAPVYVSTETMHWWLGPECFATQKCILATHAVGLAETEEDHRLERGLDNGTARSDTAWYGPQMPPVALWVAGSDNLVDGRRLLRRLRNGREPHVCVVHEKIIDDYEHLDVLWAMDAIEQVGREVRQVLWSTLPPEARAVCRTPRGVR
ncbi:lipase [Aspergillus ambiguus]|uniref:putative ab-hydrolase associated lipase n=1 Tax=Aspergillus ambiguus TaxID=176160 RepID=UPI003CCCFD25